MVLSSAETEIFVEKDDLALLCDKISGNFLTNPTGCVKIRTNLGEDERHGCMETDETIYGLFWLELFLWRRLDLPYTSFVDHFMLAVIF